MRKYTAIYTSKSKRVIKQAFEADGPESAISQAESFEAWPNVVIFDDTFTIIPGYGEMIYMNGVIRKRPVDSEYLSPSLSVYDSVRTTLSYACQEIYHKASSITSEPSLVKFLTEAGLTLQRLGSLCREEALKNNKPCRLV